MRGAGAGAVVGVRTARGTTGGAVNVVERGGKRGRLTALPRRGSAWLEDASRGGIRGGDARFGDDEVFRRSWWRTVMAPVKGGFALIAHSRSRSGR